MEPIKHRVLAILQQYGQGPDKTLLYPMLDRHLIMVEKEKEYIGGRLINIIGEMIAEGFISEAAGMRIGLTNQGKQALLPSN